MRFELQYGLGMAHADALAAQTARPTTHAESIAAAKAVLAENGMKPDLFFPCRDALNPRFFVWAYTRNGSGYEIRTDYGVLSERDLARFKSNADGVDAERMQNPAAYNRQAGHKPWGTKYVLNGASFPSVWAAWDSVPALRGELKPLSFREANERLAPLGLEISEVRP